MRRGGLFAEGEYYHVLNRGIHKRDIFLDERDYARFLFYLMYLQSPRQVYNISQKVDRFMDDGVFSVSETVVEEVLDQRYVELAAFALMPNHFHLLVKEVKENGVSRYLQRIQGGLAKHWQAKYSHEEHLFGGPFTAKLVETNVQLLHLSAYIHKNPQELRGIGRQGTEVYMWSSYIDYLGEERWGELLKPEIILEQFPSPEAYRGFVRTSIAKEYLDEDLRID